MSTFGTTGAGYGGAFVAAIMFGSNYVVTKNFPTGDGIAVSWAMSVGILCVGYACTLFNDFVFVSSGILGGSLWALGNLLVPLAIRLAGLGPAFCLWSTGNLLTGWAVGKFGAFGVSKSDLANDGLNVAGAVLGLVALFIYFFVKKVDQGGDSESTPINQYTPSGGRLDISPSYSLLDDARFSVDRDGPGIWAFTNDLDPDRKRIFGMALSVAIGIVYGFTMIPFQIWFEDEDDKGNEPGELDFAFSHYSGIFLFSTAAFLLYTAYTRNQPQLFRQTLVPGFISGVMWGIANAGFFVANANLGLAVGYPMVAITPVIISSAWSVFYFHEVQGKRDLSILSVALLINVVAVILVALSFE
eukprot:TRINITY_DN20127_c0_g1_i1.p1 TRINITY_DN20127_c0_g1~~TRINITY_DN20127_c0_g1_i1.p1  ORF type:complete len:358 (+),score=75.47 TRINITY_DN20127_c0_g1_i1:55-1128(+)